MAIKITHTSGTTVIATPHAPITLRGSVARDGLTVKRGFIEFDPRWGMTRESAEFLAVVKVSNPPDEYRESRAVAVLDTGTMPVLVPIKGAKPERELVLVQEYQTGTGAKRYPDFEVNLDESQVRVRVLARERTSGGSGSGTWTLISAPLGWAADIAAQFKNVRDTRGETISSRLSGGEKRWK